ncbi:MAG: Hint domain-containing protein [Paracoccaceae bacterium]
MGAPNIVGTSTGTVTEASGAVITGNLDDSNPWFNNDAWSITVSATYGTATINPTTGVWSYDLNDSHPAVVALNLGDTLTDTFTVRITDAGGSDTQVVTITINGAPCFTPGVRIATPGGERPVEELEVGDLVTTRDHGDRPIRWIGQRKVAAVGDLAPIRIAAGALGNRRDLIVSPQHRVLVSGWLAELHFGQPEVLVAAKHLAGGDLIHSVPGGEVIYIHIMFDDHEVIYAEGIATESFFFGGDFARDIAAQEQELRRILDELPGDAAPRTARRCVSAAEAEVLRKGLLRSGARIP